MEKIKLGIDLPIHFTNQFVEPASAVTKERICDELGIECMIKIHFPMQNA